MSCCVLDASFVFQWVFKDERTEAGSAAFARVNREGMTIPPIWWIEVTNVLGLAVRRGRLDPAGLTEALTLLSGLRITTDAVPPSALVAPVLDLMDRYRLTAYDATYLELAVRLSLPLATFDRELRAAAPQAGVTLFNP